MGQKKQACARPDPQTSGDDAQRLRFRVEKRKPFRQRHERSPILCRLPDAAARGDGHPAGVLWF